MSPGTNDGGPISIDVEARPVLSYAMAHNRIPVVARLSITGVERAASGARLLLDVSDATGSIGDGQVVVLDLRAGEPTVLQDLTLRLDPAAMLHIEEQRPGAVRCRLEVDGAIVAERTARVQLLAAHQWLSAPPVLAMEMLSAHVMPNHPAVGALMREVSARLQNDTGRPSIEGYQSGAERVDEIVRAVYETMRDRRIAYVEPPASWADDGQKVRTPGEVLDGRVGTCLDTVVVMAAVLEQAGVRPLIWLPRGHAFLGYWREESSLGVSVECDPAGVVNQVDLGLMGLVETTAMTHQDLPFEDAARRPAVEHLAGDLADVIGVVDVHQARVDRVLPLPAQVRGDDGTVQIVEYTPAEPVVGPSRHADPPSVTPRRGRSRTEPPRVTQWKNGLLDLSLRNRLINMTERSTLGVVLPDGGLGHLEDVLHRGSSITLRAGDEFAAVERERGVRSARELPQQQLTALLDQRTVYVDVTADAYPTRLRGLAYKARTIVEESGANNLYLALGTLEWQFDDRTLRSPLILVPVVLSAGRRGGRYQVALDESGTSTPNYCLIEKLRQSHGLDIPGLAEPDSDEAGIDLDAAFAATRRAIAERGLPFRVEPTADLAVLQFAKFRLWKDLDENWAELAHNPLVAHLIHTPTDAFADAVADPGVRDLEGLAEQCPVPADSSQLTAVHDAVLGRTFVLEGPPGTGKSQTITNLLAHAVAEGKRVLFVAEKRAALDVVQRRLDEIGMGPLSLDLHDKSSKPAVVREQIRVALDHAVPIDTPAHEARVEELRSFRRGLTRYWSKLAESNAAGLSLPSARDAELVHRDVEAMPVPESVMTGDPTAVARLRTAFTTLPEHVDAAGPRIGHPWAFVDQAAGVDVPGAAESARLIESLLPTLPVSLTPALDAAMLPDDLRILGSVLQTGVTTGVLDAVRTPRWESEVGSLRSDITAFVATAHPGLETVTPNVLALPIQTIAEAAGTAARSSFFGRRARLRAVAAQLSPTLRAGAKVRTRRLVDLVGTIVQFRDGVDALARRYDAIPGLSVPSGWTPYADAALPDLDGRVDRLRWASRMVDEAGSDPERQRFAAPLRTALHAGQVDPRAVLEMASATAALADACGITAQALARWAQPSGLLVRLRQTAHERHSNDPELRSLRTWLDLVRHVEPLRHDGLDDVRERILRGEIDADQARLSFDLGTARAAVAERLRTTRLDHFDPPAHDRSIHRFRDAAAEVRSHLTTVLPGRVLAGRGFDPSSAGGRVGELRRQLTMKRRGMKVRELMSTYGDLITNLTPCVLVSPDALARFFPATADLFDIVVFDEASQVRVADAVGAMGRGRSVVVVGDSLQMPPTSVAASGMGDDLEPGGADGAVQDEESILTECVQARVTSHRLSWHYRSRDEALIAFSNQMYYDGALSTFPAPISDERAISLVRVDGHFHRSGPAGLQRTNPEEARAVVDEIRRRFTASPHRPPSLGVVTFNQQQRAYIEGLLRDTDDPRLIEALEAPDGLFVKNLENVQGDERDVVLFSTAFSVNDRGVLPLNFGPLNRAGGERRLNVAVTRARRKVIVYSSFDPAQMRTEQTSSVGVRHLRTYLEVAARGPAVLPQDRRATTVCDRHRDDIATALRDRGIDVATGVGLSDFAIDLVLSVDGDARVAVLLDGPGWSGRMTAGDRDVLPHQMLGTVLGWPRVDRVWLPDWLRDRDAVVDRLVGALETAATAGAREQPPSPRSASPKIAMATAQPVPPASSAATGPGPRRPGEEPFESWSRTVGTRDVLDALPDRMAAAQVRDVLAEVVEAEGPITVERLVRLVARAFDLTRVAESRSAAIMQHLPRSVRRDDHENVAWPAHRDPRTWTGFRPSTPAQRRFEEIPLREMGNAMRAAVAAAAGMGRDELYTESLRVFGFVRRTPSVIARLDRAAELALGDGRMVLRAELFLQPDGG